MQFIPVAYRFRDEWFPADQLWQEIDKRHGQAPEMARLDNGVECWVMNSFYDAKTGKCVRLQAGNASPFTLAAR